MVPDREILLYTKSVYGATPDIKIDAKSLYSVVTGLKELTRHKDKAIMFLIQGNIYEQNGGTRGICEEIITHPHCRVVQKA